jgi:peptidoglycan/xylan/chitin deacetylase (PgdA/CDA1 family)
VSATGRASVKELVLSLASASGILRLSEFLSRRRLVVLTYHRVVPRESVPSETRPANTLFADEFEQQMAFVAHRYEVLDGRVLRAVLAGNEPIPPRALAITFDDGYENNFTCALPILRRHGLHAVFFVTSNFVGSGENRLWFDRLDRLLLGATPAQIELLLRQRGDLGPTETRGLRGFFKSLSSARQRDLLDYLETHVRTAADGPGDRVVFGPMSWEQVRSMATVGMTIGSHTENHQILAAVSEPEASSEVARSRERIEMQTGVVCWTFGYPNGRSVDFRESDERAVATAGYSCAFTQIPGSIAKDTPRFRLPRIPVPDTGDLRVFRTHVSGLRRSVAGLLGG